MEAWRRVLAGVVVVCAVAAGCGSGDDGGEAADAPPPPAKPEDFPKPGNRSLAQLRREFPAGGPVLAPSVSQLEPGRNRLGFGLFDASQAQIADAPAAVYVAPAGGGRVQGPYPARFESLEVDPQFQSAGVEADPQAARTVYVSDVRFARPGRYEMLGLVRLDGRLVAATSAAGAIEVVRDMKVPEPGEPAPRTSTPTLADVGGDVEQIDTRTPPGTMHDEDFADVLGKKPAVLLFATPALCQSKVCGPVVDIAEQVKSERGDEAAWIHMEIYKDNVVEQGFREQVVEWRLPTEPWLFTVDRRGRVAAAIEGAFSAQELEAALDAAVRG